MVVIHRRVACLPLSVLCAFVRTLHRGSERFAVYKVGSHKSAKNTKGTIRKPEVQSFYSFYIVCAMRIRFFFTTLILIAALPLSRYGGQAQQAESYGPEVKSFLELCHHEEE